jgi:predicted porin
MKKTLIATAVAAGMLATGAAQADPTVYGILHLSINSAADDHYGSAADGTPLLVGGTDMTSNTSAIGVKGSEDLGGGLKALYKAEFQVDPFVRDNAGGAGRLPTIIRRDIWVGLKGGWGKIAAGTMSHNYKQMGGKIDPLYRTVAEARAILNMQSELHAGDGVDGQGRMEKALQYTTPKMAGIEIVLNTTVSGADAGNCDQATSLANGAGCDETWGAGIRWSNKNFLVYADYLDPNAASTGEFQSGVGYVNGGKDETVSKVGGKWSTKEFQVGAQYELTKDQLGGDYMYLSGLWNISSKHAVTAAWGQQDNISSAYNVAYVHSMSKQTNVYVGYGSVSADSTGSYVLGADGKPGLGYAEDGTTPREDGSLITLGIRKSF